MNDETLTRLMHDAGPDPAASGPDRADIAALWAEGRRRSARPRIPLVLALVALVALVAVAFSLLHQTAPDTRSVEAGPPVDQFDPSAPPSPGASDAIGAIAGRLRIPAIGLDTTYVRGDDVDSIEDGPAQVDSDGRPGSDGQTTIFGHRSTFTAPFDRLDELRPGDRIEIDTSEGHFIYLVDPQPPHDRDGSTTGSLIVDPGTGPFGVPESLLSNPDSRSGSHLLLATYAPKYSAQQRLIVEAELLPG